MIVQQAVQAYLDHLKSSGYSNNERARKTRILNRWFTPALALYHSAIPSTIAALSVSNLPAAEVTEESTRFLEIFQNDSISVTYLNLAVFFEAYPEILDSATSILQCLGGRLAVKHISERVGKQVLGYLESLPVDRAASYSRTFLVFCYEQGWLSWNPHRRQRAATERVFEPDFLGSGIWADRIRQYLKQQSEKRNVSAGGIDYTVRKLKVFTEWLESRGYKEVQLTTVKEFIEHKRGQGLKETTLNKFLYTIRYFFDFLISEGLVKQKTNPAQELRIKGHQYATRQALTEAELKQVIDYLEQEIYQTKDAEQISSMVLHFRARRDLCLLLWFVLYGLRLSEMASIRLEGIDFEKRSIRIQAKGNRQVRKKHRTILIEEVGWKTLREYLKERPYPRQPYLWISWSGCPLRASSINNLIHQRVRQAGIRKPISPHCLRTTCASLYVSKGMDPYSLKSLLGHESLKTTMDHYARLTEEQLREVWKNTNPLVGFDDE
jgi:site-specific recombinase XerD